MIFSGQLLGRLRFVEPHYMSANGFELVDFSSVLALPNIARHVRS